METYKLIMQILNEIFAFCFLVKALLEMSENSNRISNLNWIALAALFHFWIP